MKYKNKYNNKYEEFEFWQHLAVGSIIISCVGGAVLEKMGIENAMPALMLIVGGLLIAYGAVLGYRKDVKLLPLARV
ncbi:hypothetical protein IJT17_05300, partial [bacterium]|nr:hypothetical protein [bacterium]